MKPERRGPGCAKRSDMLRILRWERPTGGCARYLSQEQQRPARSLVEPVPPHRQGKPKKVIDEVKEGADAR